MSIRLRLTLWYSGILATILTAFGVLLYVILAQGLFREAEQSVKARADQVARTLLVQPTPSGPPVVILPRMDVFASPGTFMQAVDAFGVVFDRSANLDRQALPVTPSTMAAARTGKPVLERVRVENELLLIYNRPMFPDEPPTGVIQVARSLSPIQDVLNRLRLLLLAIGAGGLVVAGTLGALLARKALDPINRLTQVAGEIGASQDLSRRVTYEGPGDEVGRLAATFNQMLDALESAKEQLAAALAAQRRFVADASHELRTPLQAIRTNAEVLRLADATVDPAERAQALDDIVSEAERLSRLVSDLLALARADAGMHLELVPTALDPILSDVYRQARLLGGSRRISLEGGPAGMVKGDADALKQLFLILVDNAIKYTPPEGEVRISAGRADGRVVVRVSDTGRGIAPEDLPHIFERFYRADRARQTGGSGLGLSIARWIVQEHGGRIEVESTPGRGTTFTVSLPAADCHS